MGSLRTIKALRETRGVQGKPEFGSGASRTVLMLLATNGAFSMRRQIGAQGVASARGWKFHAVNYSSFGDPSLKLRNSLTGDNTVSALLEFWHPDGCIVECPQSKDSPVPSGFGRVPTVFIASSSRPYASGQISVCIDNASFAQAAATELFEFGFDDYAFVPIPGEICWSVERGREFKRIVRAAGKRFHAFVHQPGAINSERMVESFAAWLRTLPKPVGVFAADDMVAECVLLGCASLRLAVPDEVAVVGVDDSEYICENTTPTLSSIRQSFEDGGRMAAELLADMMDNPGKAFASRKYGAGRAVRRESTRFAKAIFRDKRLQLAMDFICGNACRGIGPKDVAKAMFVSRPVADDVFRKGLDSTILTEIHAVRLGRAKEMLARGVRPDIVAQECGYGSLNDFRRVFKRRLGTTIRRWLKER